LTLTLEPAQSGASAADILDQRWRGLIERTLPTSSLGFILQLLAFYPVSAKACQAGFCGSPPVGDPERPIDWNSTKGKQYVRSEFVTRFATDSS